MNKYAQRVQELGGKLRDVDFPRASEEDVVEAESRLGAELPADYREFVREFGGYDIDALFPIRATVLDGVWPLDPTADVYVSQYQDADGKVAQFAGIAPGEGHGFFDIVSSHEHLSGMVENWPEEWLPIGSGDGSDFLVLTYKGEKKGAVLYIWDASMSLIYLAANSFDEFMQSLRPADYGENA